MRMTPQCLAGEGILHSRSPLRASRGRTKPLSTLALLKRSALEATTMYLAGGKGYVYIFLKGKRLQR